MNSTDSVENAEVLYRAARPNDISIKSGRVVISSKTFHDSQQQISVDRAQIQNNDPLPTRDRLPQATGVVSVTASEARDVSPIDHIFHRDGNKIELNEDGTPRTTSSEVDVVPDPWPKSCPSNAAHALIRGTPEFGHKNMFKLLIKHLAYVAKVEVDPSN